jgi:hypothetical protein
MSSQDNFVARWSRMKREAAAQSKAETPAPKPREARGEQPAKPLDDVHAKPEPPFDPATLPPIDSIVAGSDIRAFLQKGVPAELTNAALRRAWTSDPAIRDFIGLAENQWDFTDPAGIPGFGPLEASDRVHDLVAQAMGKLPEADAAGLSEESRGAVPSDRVDEVPAPPRPGEPGPETEAEIAASQQEDPRCDVAPPPRRKGHGRALPQ